MTRILVIEDDPTVRKLILKFLQSEGFEVMSAENGSSGIELAQMQEPDLIVCDVMMPECNGYEVLERLQTDPATARIPFIFLTAKIDKADLRHGMDLGADDYLTKPFQRHELINAVTARLAKQAKITQPYINEMKRAAQSLGQLAYRDPLTGLPNRILLHQQLQDSLSQAKRNQKFLAVLYLNLDRFKTINLNWGHAIGDALLQSLAERLNQTLGQEHTVARLGSDEFCLVLGNLEQLQQVREQISYLLQVLEAPFDLDGQLIQVQTSIGVALYPEQGHSPDQLLNRAEIASRHAKQQHHQKFCFYDLEMDSRVVEQQLIETHLGQALERSELVLYYQPQVNLVTGRIIGAEALLRWQHSKLGLLLPNQFIPVAEETGQIVPIGEWVLKSACLQAKTWQSIHPMSIRVAVNLSARQFNQHNLADTVSQVLQASELDPNLLVIEMTETNIMEDVASTIASLQALKSLGIQLAVDDFGTGYSSLNYLKRFPIDTLKIDRSFVTDITNDVNDAAIAKAIIALAQSLQLKVVAEGVETAAQLQFLKQSGCQAVQGYLFSPPVTAAEFAQLLSQDQRL